MKKFKFILIILLLTFTKVTFNEEFKHKITANFHPGIVGLREWRFTVSEPRFPNCRLLNDKKNGVNFILLTPEKPTAEFYTTCCIKRVWIQVLAANNQNYAYDIDQGCPTDWHTDGTNLTTTCANCKINYSPPKT